MIIGLTGKNASGKGTVADFLRQCGFMYYSLSDVIRDELATRSEEPTRENMIRVGNELRIQGGPGVLAHGICRRLDPAHNTVVDSIRNPAEVQVLRDHGGFVLLEVTAPEELRFERSKSRGRVGDPTDLDSFRALEQKELTGDPASQQLIATAQLADRSVENAGNMEALNESLQTLVLELLQSQGRPGWDDYFMGIAFQVAMRSNCVKRRVGAVISKDRRIISTGYNGTPRGALNCNEGGCPRCNALAASGTKLDECLCSHAEENALTQSAYHGTSVAEGTIYVTLSPCLMCTKMLINAGIREVVYNADYPLGETAKSLLERCGLTLRRHRYNPRSS
jgi:dCMP deaminase